MKIRIIAKEIQKQPWKLIDFIFVKSIEIRSKSKKKNQNDSFTGVKLCLSIILFYFCNPK